MYLICPKCQKRNEGDAHFCKTCGTGFNVKPIRKNSIATPVMMIIAVVAVCAVCGLFGLIGDISKRGEVAQSNTSTARQFTTNQTSSEPSGIDDAPVKTPVPVKSGQGATVITENANLRETPNQSGEVIQTLPQNSPVEIVHQKGAWFLVRADGQTGWMHGNTIRLDETNLTELPRAVPPIYTEPKPRREPPAATINKSGASALCRDGTLSYSRNRRGTCSHHGGVAQWY